MKTKRICKSIVSLILAVMMLVSMFTVGIVSTSAAETDATVTGADTKTIYFANNKEWASVAIHYWGSTSTTWPGTVMTKNGDTYNGFDVYEISIPSGSTGMIFNNNNQGEQTNDITDITDGAIYTLGTKSDKYTYNKHTDYTPGGPTAFYLLGEFNSWNISDTSKFTGSGDTVTLTMEIPAGTYGFKVYNGNSTTGTYYGNTGDIEDECSGWTFKSSTDECTLIATGGTYNFSFVKSTMKLTVTHTPDDTEETKTVYVGRATNISDASNTGIAWLYSNSQNDNAALKSTGKTQTFTVNGVTETYEIFTAEIPVPPTGVTATYQWKKVTPYQKYGDNSLSNADGNILLLSSNHTTDVQEYDPNASSGGVTVKDKIAFAMVNGIHLYSVTVDCISSTGVKTTVQIKEKNDLDTNRIAKNINGKLVEWPDSMDDTKPKQWSIFSVDIPADTKYIHFNTGHNSGTDVYWHLPLGDDAVEKDATETFNPDYHDLSNYDYTSELYVLYEYNNNEGNDNDKTKGYKSIKKTYEQFTDEEIPVFEITAKCAIKDQENDYDNEITIDPAGSSASLAGSTVDWTYSVYLVNGDEDTLLASGLASDYKFPYTMTTPNTTYEFYIVVKPVGDTTNTATSDPVSTDYIATADPVLSATFKGTQTATEVTIVPNAVYNDVTLERSEYSYNVYLKTEEDTEYNKVNSDLIPGTTDYQLPYNETVKDGKNLVYIEVVYGDLTATTDYEEYTYPVVIETVTFNVGLKSSTSYRYIPYVSVNGKEAVEMTYDKETPQESNKDYICHNKNGTQSYYWHWAEITIPVGEDAKITFTNLYNTIGSTITLSADDIEANKSYQFGYDNLNYSNTVVWYDPLVDSDTVINFVETATHMVKADENSTECAQTRVNGTTYYVGDADGDGKLTIMDATTVQLALAKKTELTAVGTQIADYNLNNKLDIFDATIIQKKLAN